MRNRTGSVGSNAARASVLVAAVAILAAALPSVGCVRRTITITTEPPNARVFLNDQEIGRSQVTTDFLWYGDYEVAVRKEGHQTLQTSWRIDAPWYQWIPFDFVAEVLWPGHIHDVHARHFVLKPEVLPTEDDLTARALETRMRALDPRK
jgi:hypothetical protein